MKCKLCGKELYAHNTIYLTEYDEPICEHCFLTENFKRCRFCGSIIKKEKYCCDNCTKKVFQNTLNSYGTKVNTIFINRKNDNKNNIGGRYYGMELEFSNTNPLIAKAVFKDEYNNQLIYNKSDSSLIGNGVEIVTVPMTKNRLLDLINRMDFKEFEKSHSHPDNLYVNAGVHIHVSRNTISPFDMTKLSFLLNGVDSMHYKRIMYYLCGRIKTPNAITIDDHYYEIGTASGKNILDPNFVSSHNIALNLGNNNTIEFRLFKSSTNKDELKSYIEIVHNLIEFVEKNPLKNINIPNFINYLYSNTKNTLLKSKLETIFEERKDYIGYRENDFKINNLIKFIEGNSIRDKIKILELLMYVKPSCMDYNNKITLEFAQSIPIEEFTNTCNARIKYILKHLKEKLVEDILTSV